VLVPTSFNPNTSYRSHALGFGAGIIFAVFYFLIFKGRFRSAERVEWD
jgi:hypothetical protein